MNAPVHLTPFGVWLWLRLPRWRRRSVRLGEGFVGIRSERGFVWAGVMVDCYHGFLHPSFWRVLYWRRSVWLFGVPILRWRRLPRWRERLPVDQAAVVSRSIAHACGA